MQFEFATAARIIFGPGKLNSIGDIIAGMGDRAFVVSGAPKDITDRLLDLLELRGFNSSVLKVEGEPTVDSIREATDIARYNSASLVMGLGGGSALDTAKVTAVLVKNPGDVTDYLEGIGLNKSLTHPSLPLIAIPTTSGTGSEVTRNAVIGSTTHHMKVSLRSPYLLPLVALVDPELTVSVPPEITAITGMDALTQLVEPYICNSPNPLTDALCIEGIQHIARSFQRAYDNGRDLEAREDMSTASLFSGLALANARLGAVHGLAGPVGGEITAHHGAICASLLPLVMETNVNEMIMHSPSHPALQRYIMIGKLLSGEPDATAHTAIHWVDEMNKYMKIQSLAAFGLAETQFDVIIEKALKARSMKGNPVTLSEVELRNILQKSLTS